MGDLLILPRTGNVIATLADAGLVLLWLFSEIIGAGLSFTDMLLITALAGVFEYLYHIWLLRDHDPVKKQQA
nr:DUF2512 family protein [Paenibacillus tengchongensis]